MESFVVCEIFKGAPYLNLPLDIGGYVNVQDYAATNLQSLSLDKDDPGDDTKLDPAFIPFLACGDLSGWHGMILDADKSYEIDAKSHIAPIAPPLDPPYQESLKRQKEERQKRS